MKESTRIALRMERIEEECRKAKEQPTTNPYGGGWPMGVKLISPDDDCF